jgi:hypothetical protein
VGPHRGVYAKAQGGFVDTNCFFFDKLACNDVFPEWAMTRFAGGTGGDRQILRRLIGAHGERVANTLSTTGKIWRVCLRICFGGFTVPAWTLRDIFRRRPFREKAVWRGFAAFDAAEERASCEGRIVSEFIRPLHQPTSARALVAPSPKWRASSAIRNVR